MFRFRCLEVWLKKIAFEMWIKNWGEVEDEPRLKMRMGIWEVGGGSWQTFPLFPEEILTKQGNVFIGLPRLVSAVSD